MARIRMVRILTVVVGAAAGAAVNACSGGSAAAPTFSPIATAVVNEDAGAPVVSDASAAAGDGGDASTGPGDGSVGAIMAAFQERCGTSPATGSIPADVAAVLADKCQTCHDNPPKNGAPFPLLTYEDVHKLFIGTTPIYEQMYIQIQPNAQPRMPFGNAPQLTPAEFSTLSSWLIACAPPGD